MPDIKGDKLYVNLGASQTRKRLKGFGHGVRKVETAGRNRAVIIHTALGHNLAALEAKFADVGSSRADTELGEPVANLKNIGPTSAAWLRDAGIHTIAQLAKIGAVSAFRRIKRSHPEATLNLLWAIAAGLKDIDFRQLDEATQIRLATELQTSNAQ